MANFTKAEIEELLKKNFFVYPTGYPSQNGFLDYGPALTVIKQRIIAEYKNVFMDENVIEIEPSAVLPYDVLKNSGHIDKFCDVILTDGEVTVRADHYIEEKIGENFQIPEDLKVNFGLIKEKIEKLKQVIIDERHKKVSKGKSIEKSISSLSVCSESTTAQFTQEEVNSILSHFKCNDKALSDLDKQEIDFVVFVYNLHSPTGLPFNPSKDYNLIFKINEKQFLRPELAQSVFTNFRRLYDLNFEKLPFAGMSIGRSYRNEISARGGMLRTKEFEQAEIEYFSEDGSHQGFDSIKNVEVLLLSNKFTECRRMTIASAYENKVISSTAICYYIAKSQEFLLNIGFSLDSLRYRQHNVNEMAHYANDCWDVEIKTLSGWIECAGIADRACYDLGVHSKNVNTYVKRSIAPKKVYEIVLNKAELGKTLKSKIQDLVVFVESISQEFIAENMIDGKLSIDFEGNKYEVDVKEKMVDYELFIPRVIEPSFGISRVLYSLVEQGYSVRDDRIILKLKPKMCYIQVVITYLKYQNEFESSLISLKKEFKENQIRFKINDRGCSIGRKYSSCDEIGVPFFITYDFETLNDNCVTIRERDSTSQIRVPISKVTGIISSLISEKATWDEYAQEYGIVN